MTCSNTCCTFSCPTVSDVTVSEVNLTLDSIASFFVVDSTRNGTLTQSTANGSVFVLSTTPVSQNGLVVELNGVPQLNGVDFTLSGDVITLTDTYPLGDAFASSGYTLTARYLSSVPGSAAETFPVGSTTAMMYTSVPDGWLECNGQTVTRATYAALFAKIGTTYNTGGEADTEFSVPHCTFMLESGGVAVTKPMLIKV